MYCVKINKLSWQYETALEAWNNKPLQVRLLCPQMNLGNGVVTGVSSFDEFVRLLDAGKTLQYHALTVCRIKKTAYLYNKGNYSYFKVGNHVVKFITSPYLERYVRVKEYDKGYMVVDLKLSTMDDVDEDYLDMNYVYRKLELDTGVLGEINEVVIR